MNKEELIKVICATVLKEPSLSKNDMEDSNKCGRKSNYKNGLYFLYNADDQIIYIGQIGNSTYTSLYDRMIGHGKGSHNKKDSRWYQFVTFGKFHQFTGVTSAELNQIERLAIAGMNHPVYNDNLDITQAVVNSIAQKV